MSLQRAEALAAKGFLPQSTAARALRMSPSGLSVSRKSAKVEEVKFGREIFVNWAEVRAQYAKVADLLEVPEDAIEVLQAFPALVIAGASDKPAKKQQKRVKRAGASATVV